MKKGVYCYYMALIKTTEEIDKMRIAGKKLATVVTILEKAIMPGVSGADIDVLAKDTIIAQGGVPSFIGYGDPDNPFPSNLCFSLNDAVVHGIPTADQTIADGDLVKIDIGLTYDGYHADMARTICVGAVAPEAQKLRDTAKTCFDRGVATIKDGATLEDYACAAQAPAIKAGYGIVRNLVGHGIGTDLHEEPQIPNYWDKRMGNFTFQEGMVVALEPMINTGVDDTIIDDDGWTFRTVDGSLSAHWENTVLVTKNGYEILTA